VRRDGFQDAANRSTTQLSSRTFIPQGGGIAPLAVQHAVTSGFDTRHRLFVTVDFVDNISR
jgi:hypothetical protein